jgi:hypothetical protein
MEELEEAFEEDPSCEIGIRTAEANDKGMNFFVTPEWTVITKPYTKSNSFYEK